MTEVTQGLDIEVKICGITTVEDAELALEAGADYLGFVLYEKSRRYVTKARLREIVGALPRRVRAIGVFVNMGPDEVRRIVADCGLYAAQIHGTEPEDAFRGLDARLWRAVRYEAHAWEPAPSVWNVERFVADAVAPEYGGSGRKADWDAARELARERRMMLAGGLTAENVADAIRFVRPLGVDVASGVEAAPGRKDAAKVRAFIQKAREAARALKGL